MGGVLVADGYQADKLPAALPPPHSLPANTQTLAFGFCGESKCIFGNIWLLADLGEVWEEESLCLATAALPACHRCVTSRQGDSRWQRVLQTVWWETFV